MRPALRSRLEETAWFCAFARCDVAYFDLFERLVTIDHLRSPVYPKDVDAPVCACFGFSLDDIEDDVRQGTPTGIRNLLARSKSDEAHCRVLAADGRCCLREVQRLYISQTSHKKD